MDDKAQFDDHFLVISRQLKVTCAAEFTSLTKRGRLEEGYDGLGVFWSWDLNNAEAYWGGKGASVNLQARVALSEIDLESTLLLNLDYELGERETEIRLYEGSVVEIMMIENCTTGSKVPIRRVSFTS